MTFSVPPFYKMVSHCRGGGAIYPFLTFNPTRSQLRVFWKAPKHLVTIATHAKLRDPRLRPPPPGRAPRLAQRVDQWSVKRAVCRAVNGRGPGGRREERARRRAWAVQRVRVSGSAAVGGRLEPLGRTLPEGAGRARDASEEPGSRSVARGRRDGRRAGGGAVRRHVAGHGAAARGRRAGGNGPRGVGLAWSCGARPPARP